MTDVQPCTGTSSVNFAQSTQASTTSAPRLRSAPNSATSRRGRVPEVSTRRQKCEASRRVEYPDGRPRSSRILTGQTAVRLTTHVRATSR